MIIKFQNYSHVACGGNKLVHGYWAVKRYVLMHVATVLASQNGSHKAPVGRGSAACAARTWATRLCCQSANGPSPQSPCRTDASAALPQLCPCPGRSRRHRTSPPRWITFSLSQRPITRRPGCMLCLRVIYCLWHRSV